MDSALIDKLTGTQAVGKGTGRRLLVAAVAAQDPVEMRANCEGVDLSCCGRLTDTDHCSLSVYVGPAAGAFQASSRISVMLDVEGRRYEFETRCAGQSDDTEPGVIRLVWPEVIVAVERRRSPRRGLRQATEVALRFEDNEDKQTCVATMLNLSLDGIAIRAPTGGAEALFVGQPVQVSFDLGQPKQSFELMGRVMSITPAGSSEQIVVGLEFAPDGALQASHRALLRILEAPEEGIF